MTLKLYYINQDYISYLRKFDSKVFYNKRTTRPYVGVVVIHNGFNYFAPLASPKPKHQKLKANTIDIFKISNGELGILNINNMIPTPKSCLTEVLPLINDEKYKFLLEKQITFLNDNKRDLFLKINNFMCLYHEGKLKKIENRCCNFRLLEEKCLEYSTLIGVWIKTGEKASFFDGKI